MEAKDLLINRTIANVTAAQQAFDHLHPEVHSNGAILEDFKIMEILKIVDSATAAAMVNAIHHAWFKDVLKKLNQLK